MLPFLAPQSGLIGLFPELVALLRAQVKDGGEVGWNPTTPVNLVGHCVEKDSEIISGLMGKGIVLVSGHKGVRVYRAISVSALGLEGADSPRHGRHRL